MPETSNAPRELYAAVDDDGGVLLTSISPKFVVLDRETRVTYLRRDLVVPTVQEVVDALWSRSHDWTPEEVDAHWLQAQGLREWLLSRIEGDNDER